MNNFPKNHRFGSFSVKLRQFGLIYLSKVGSDWTFFYKIESFRYCVEHLKKSKKSWAKTVTFSWRGVGKTAPILQVTVQMGQLLIEMGPNGLNLSEIGPIDSEFSYFFIKTL